MEKRSPVRVLYIRDDKDTGRPVEERLAQHGFTVSTAGGDQAHTALRARDTYDVLCIDLTAAKPGSFHELHQRDEGGNFPPTIMITGPETAAAAGQFMDLGPVCCLVRDADGRYLDALTCLIERLGAAQTLAREKQEIEEALGEARERLFMSQKMEAIGMLAGGVAHDFNNILATILGYASFLRGKAAPEDVFFEGLSAIEDSAVRASELTSQLQAYSRRGKMEIKEVPVNRVVKEIHNLIRKTFDNSIDIRLDLNEDVTTVDADVSQIKQMILNLAINARDAMPKGGALIIRTFMSTIPDGQIEVGRDIPPGDYVGISVSDTGPGMDRQTGQEVFEPSGSEGRRPEGAGAGLSAAYEVAKRHGGWIDVKSEAGAGTEFLVRLAASGKKEEAPAKELREAKGGSETILIVDDETQIVQMLTRLLTDFGYRVFSSDSGAEGARIFEERAGEIDLVLLDIMMPGMGGKEVMGRILQLRPDARILLASGYSEQERHRDLMEMGAVGFIGKPFVVRDLLGKIRDVLG
jgi:signal transduction histidine kinase